MGLGPEYDPGDVRILTAPCRTALRTLLFRILPARSLLLALKTGEPFRVARALAVEAGALNEREEPCGKPAQRLPSPRTS